MAHQEDQIGKILGKLEALARRQEEVSQEIYRLRKEIYRVKNGLSQDHSAEPATMKPEEIASQKVINPSGESMNPPVSDEKTGQEPYTIPAPPDVRAAPRENLEKFIGENLSNKIGIIIMIIGVAIGVRYTIENELFTPIMRVMAGYLTGVVLLATGLRLRRNFENFSAVLLSGAMAIMYFITWFAYDFYALISQVPAFVAMLIFTVFTVLAALRYNRQIIAHIGLVGAYAVPFLLSGESENVVFLFVYMAIINTGIFAVSVKKYWKALFYSSFGFTNLIFLSWFLFSYNENGQFTIALGFLSLFFILFYASFLAYKLLRDEKFGIHDVFLLLANSFVFYGLGMVMLYDHFESRNILGWFTAGNALIHFGVSALVYFRRLADRNLVFLITGLGLVFLTLTIPVVLEGNWVSLLWAGEAALLFWIGRTRGVPFYEKLSYPLVAMAFFSIAVSWGTEYQSNSPSDISTRITPLFHIHFLSSLVFTGIIGWINYVHHKKRFSTRWLQSGSHVPVISVLLSALLLVSLYFTFRIEIALWWDQLYAESGLIISEGESGIPVEIYNEDLKYFKSIWMINYTLAFLSVLAWVNLKWIKSRDLAIVNFVLNGIGIGFFLAMGLYLLGLLRESYLADPTGKIYHQSVFYLFIRYVSYAFAALCLLFSWKYTREANMLKRLKVVFDIIIHLAGIWVASSELIHWMEIAGASQPWKFGISILWGVYALLLVVLGIRYQKKHLRIGAIGLFGITLVKLFVFDISHLDNLTKTIFFISMGVLLLFISFLYNKYRHLIASET
ncbi:MAG: DUF2339 domain-containing protein [Bacteroidota bacterium]